MGSGEKLDFSCLAWTLPSTPFQAVSRAGAQLGSASHLCLALVLTHCLTQAVKALGSCSDTSFHRAFEPQEENKHSIKAEILSSNIFACADHHLLCCLTHVIQHWYVCGMRINYSEYVQPILPEMPLLVKILKKREILEVRFIPSPGEDSCMWLSLGNATYCSKGEYGPLPKAKQDYFEDDYGPVTLNPSGYSCIVLKAFPG